jgi:tight adherence protein C
VSITGPAIVVVLVSGSSAAVAVVSAALAIPARPPRVDQLVQPSLGHPIGSPSRPRRLLDGAAAGAEAVGLLCSRLVGRPISAQRARIVGGSLLMAGLTGVVVHPVVGAAAALAVWSWPVVRTRRARRLRQRAVVDGLPDVVDLLRLAIAAGLTVGHALDAVAPHTSGPFTECFHEVRRRIDLGVPTLEALDALDDLDEPAVPLHLALASSERDGAPLRHALDQVVREARHLRRRAAEERARRLPVQLLFPLVVCILPSFGLLTVVPLLAGSLRSLAI